ncbi:MAG: DMT family transporter [Labrys sp. (in: a-proteobacteria)]|jgi:drug/metabolite transporter (DMT)-like permease
MRSRETLGLLLGITGVVIFGGSLPMTRYAVTALDPWFITVSRAAIAGLAAILVVAMLRRPLPNRAALPKLALSALLLVGGFPGFTGIAMATVPASHGGVVVGLLPLATATASAILMRERPSLAFWLCGIAGAALVVAFAVLHGGAQGFAAGDALLLLAVASAAVGYTISASLSRTMPGWEVISWCVILALPVTIPATLWLWPADAGAIGGDIWAALAYLGLMSMYLGFFFWNAGMAMGGVARVSQTQLLQTFVTLGFAALINGETIDGATLAFAVAVVLVVMIGRRTRIASTQAQPTERSRS